MYVGNIRWCMLVRSGKNGRNVGATSFSRQRSGRAPPLSHHHQHNNRNDRHHSDCHHKYSRYHHFCVWIGYYRMIHTSSWFQDLNANIAESAFSTILRSSPTIPGWVKKLMRTLPDIICFLQCGLGSTWGPSKIEDSRSANSPEVVRNYWSPGNSPLCGITLLCVVQFEKQCMMWCSWLKLTLAVVRIVFLLVRHKRTNIQP